MILKLLILVVLVLVVFEGKLIHTMFSNSSSSGIVTASASDPEEPQSEDEPSEAEVREPDTDLPAPTAADPSANGGVAVLAGLSTGDPSSGNEEGQMKEVIDSQAVVPYTEPPIDDSYFRDAVFIGDSRMEGFRNTSGITQGVFMTSVGMALTDLGDTTVSTPDGQITVYQGLSGRQYGKIYLMLGTNDLGFYPWDIFLETAEGVLEQFHELQPNAIIYVCGVIYVEGTFYHQASD